MNQVSFASPSATISLPSAWKGLTSQEAREQLAQCGPNDPTPVRRGAALTELFFLFLNPLVIILLVAALVSFLLG
ncbi:MAG: cation-transporting P-type ATPase, partial [Candidatus Acidiferrum sp.]